MEPKRRSGRPKKAESEKVQYQRIAVYREDYEKVADYIRQYNVGKSKTDKLKLTDVFTTMVKKYCK